MLPFQNNGNKWSLFKRDHRRKRSSCDDREHFSYTYRRPGYAKNVARVVPNDPQSDPFGGPTIMIMSYTGKLRQSGTIFSRLHTQLVHQGASTIRLAPELSS